MIGEWNALSLWMIFMRVCVCLRIEAIPSHIFYGPLHVKPQSLDIPKKNRLKNARLWNKSLRADVQIAFNVLKFSLDLKKNCQFEIKWSNIGMLAQ